MIVLDTSVVSELMRKRPADVVVRWVNAQPGASLYVTSITEAEILRAVLVLPKGKRRDKLAMAVTEMFDQDFRGRILPFGSDAAVAYSVIATARRRAGRPIAAFDAQIAAVARANGAAVATANTEGYADCGIEVIDPWSHKAQRLARTQPGGWGVPSSR